MIRLRSSGAGDYVFVRGMTCLWFVSEHVFETRYTHGRVRRTWRVRRREGLRSGTGECTLCVTGRWQGVRQVGAARRPTVTRYGCWWLCYLAGLQGSCLVSLRRLWGSAGAMSMSDVHLGSVVKCWEHDKYNAKSRGNIKTSILLRSILFYILLWFFLLLLIRGRYISTARIYAVIYSNKLSYIGTLWLSYIGTLWVITYVHS